MWRAHRIDDVPVPLDRIPNMPPDCGAEKLSRPYLIATKARPQMTETRVASAISREGNLRMSTSLPPHRSRGRRKFHSRRR